MASLLKTFQHSFLDKRILSTFLIDLLFFGAFALLVFLLSIIQQSKTTALGLTSPEQLQELLLNSPEQAQAVLLQLQSYLLAFAIGLLILLVVWILGYPLSRKYVWQVLSGKKQPLGKWIVLSLVIALPLIALFIPLFLAKVALTFLVGKLPFVLQQYVGNVIFLALGLILVLYLVVTYFSFSHAGKIWESIGKGFHYFRRRTFWMCWLLVLVTVLVVNLLLSLLQRLFSSFFLSQPQLFTFLSAAVFLLFLAWVRVYLVQTLPEPKAA